MYKRYWLHRRRYFLMAYAFGWVIGVTDVVLRGNWAYIIFLCIAPLWLHFLDRIVMRWIAAKEDSHG